MAGPASQPGPNPQVDPLPGPASQPAPKVRVLIVEDDPFVRTGLADLLDSQSHLTCCGQEGSLAGAARAVAQQPPDLLLIDLQLQDGESLGLINSLRFQHPQMAILVLSHQDEALYALKALQAGARGYLMKEAAAEHLLSAISRVLKGKTYLSDAMAAQLRPFSPWPTSGLPADRPARPRRPKSS